MQTISKDAVQKLPERARTKTSHSNAVRPRLILPNLHEKTHFKAAMEYSIVDTIDTQRSLVDVNHYIQRVVEDGKFAQFNEELKEQ